MMGKKLFGFVIVVVLLAALVYSGDIVFHISGKEFSATNIAAMSEERAQA